MHQWSVGAFVALVVASPVATGGAATRTADVPAKLLGVWHKKLTQAEWARVGVSRESGVYTAVIMKNGDVVVYLSPAAIDRAAALARRILRPPSRPRAPV